MADEIINSVEIEPLEKHWDEVQFWLYRAGMGYPLDHLQALAIWLAEAITEGFYNHMSIRKGEDVWTAVLPRVVKVSAGTEALYDGRIEAYAFNPPLLMLEELAVLNCLEDMEGKSYDWILTGQRGLKALLTIARYLMQNPVLDFVGSLLPADLAGSEMVMCYESVARVINASGRLVVNPATFGPRDLRAACDAGHLVFRGIVVNQGGYERC